MQHTLAIEDLLERPDWIRDLAYSLVSDAATADDLIQEAWMSALQSVTAEVQDPQGWFAKILRNVANKHWRSSSQRESREAKSATKEALPSAADLVARVSLQRDLIGNILALESKHRDVLILRYFEDCSIADIAKRLEIPLATADSRLQRSKVALRDRLDKEYGDRSSWCVALLPLALASKFAGGAGLAIGATAGSSAGVNSLFGSALKSTSTMLSYPLVKLALPALLILVGFIALSGEDPEDTGSRPERREPLANLTETGSPTSELAAQTDVGLSRSVVAISTQEAAAADSTVPYTGRLIGADGEPIANARVGWVTPETVHWLPTPGRRKIGNETEVRLVKKQHLEHFATNPEDIGRMLQNIPDAQISLWTDAFRDDEPMIAEVETDDQGLFTLRVPGPWEKDGTPIGHPRLVLEGHLLHTVGWTPSANGSRERILLAVPTADIAGHVTDVNGTPLSNFRFRLDGQSSEIENLPLILSSEEYSPWRNNWFQADANGNFDLKGVYAIPGIKLEFSKRALGAFRAAIPPGQTSGLTVQLIPRDFNAAPVRKIHGIVRGPDGKPICNAHVFHRKASTKTAADGKFSLAWIPTLEEVEITIAARGHVSKREVIHNPSRNNRDRYELSLGAESLTISGALKTPSGSPLAGYGVTIFDPTYSAGDTMTGEERATLGAPRPVTDADGKFTIFGLEDREYRLVLWNSNALERMVTMPLMAGTDGVVLIHKAGATYGSIKGRVVDSKGNGVAGADIRGGFRHIAYEDNEFIPGWQAKSTWESVTNYQTDQDGFFAVPALSRAFDFLNVSGSGLEPKNIFLDHEGPFDLKIEVSHLYGFRFAADSIAAYYRLEAFDKEGSAMPLYIDAVRGVIIKRPRYEVTKVGGNFPFCEVPVGTGSLTLFAKDGSTLNVLLNPRIGAVDVLKP